MRKETMKALVLAVLLLAAEECTACANMAGSWYDSASGVVMDVEEASCKLRSKYGEATVSPNGAVKVGSGLLHTLGLTGRYSEHTNTIEWSNGMVWTQRQKNMEHRVELLERTVQQLSSQLAQLASCCSKGSATPTPPPAPTPSAAPTPTSSTPPPAPTSTPPPPSPPSPPGSEVQELRKMVEELNATVANATGPKGRDGWCTIEPNTTDVYIPVTRYVYRKWANADKCTFGGAVGTKLDVTDSNCKWSSTMHADPILAYKGDTIVFWQDDARFNIYRMKDKKAFDECDFRGAKLVAGLLDVKTLIKAGKNFSVVLDEPGVHYFASDRQGQKEPERREYCWDPDEDASSLGITKKWGKRVKVAINVLDPTKEVMGTCPLYDPSKYGVSQGGKAADSATVTRLKGVVAAIARQLIAMEVRIQQRIREEGQSGLTVVRSYGQGTDAYHESTYANVGAANAHNHANTHHTIGMGEFAAVLNGVQFTTRHNDYSLEQPKNVPKDEYITSWPPKSDPIDSPPVPDAVLKAGGVDAQVKEMREWFRAFHTQNTTHRDYRPYFRPVLCYLEGTWINAQEDIAEPFASERHHIDAENWKDLNEKTNFYFNSGQKNNLENLPHLPSAFRGMQERDGEEFEPILAQWTYRIKCIPLKDDLPTTRFRVKNELHVQMRESRPKTRAQLAETPRALFDVNPAMDSSFKPDKPWPKGKTSYEYIDYLMEQAPGFDGPQGDLRDSAFGPMCSMYTDASKELNTAYYSRYYQLQSKDAMGRSVKKRGFHDYLFAAQTTHPRVNPLSVCGVLGSDQLKSSTDPKDTIRNDECKSIKDENTCNAKKWEEYEVGGGAQGAKCVWSSRSCVYKKCWTQRWSWAVPLEVVYQTPLQTWNPYDIEYFEKSTPGYDEVTAGGRNGKKGKAYKGTRQDNFYRTPESFFKDATHVDAADTSGGVTYVLDKSGKEREVRASGYWITFPEIEGIGKVRQRYPIFPVHDHGATVWKEVKALEELVVGGHTKDELKEIIAETRSEAYGVELKLMEGSGHTHQISIGASELLDLKTGKKAYTYKTSSLGNGHAHRVKLTYNASNPSNPWIMDWCSMSTDNCPWKLSSLKPAGCGNENSVSCCNDGTCPDGHHGLEVMH